MDASTLPQESQESMPLQDRTNTFQSVDNALVHPFDASGMLPLNTSFLNTMQFDIMNGLMDPMDPRTFMPSSSESSSLDEDFPCTILPSSGDFSCLDEDFPALDDMHSTQGDFGWAFNIRSPVEASSDHDAQQTDTMGLSEDLTGVEDDDDDDGHNAAGIVIDTSHWDRAFPAIDEDEEGTTWAQRNSERPVVPVQSRRGNASKETRKLMALQAHARHKALIVATEGAKHEIDTILQRVANEHGKKIDVIKQLAFSQTRHRYQRAVSLQDAKVSWKMKQEKDKLLPGERPKTLAEIQALVKDDIEMENWSKETQEKMIQRVREIRAIKAQGARVSNHAAAMDYRKTIDRVEQELSNLVPRTGAMAIALFTRAHVDDTFAPDIFASSGAEGFVREILRMDPLDLVRKFEQWACSRALTLEDRETMPNLRKDITSRILASLRFITKKPTASMSYSRYQTDIIERHGVELTGWPARLLPLKPPLDIRVLADLKLLRNALVEGSCRWIHLSRPDVQDRINKHQRRAESSDIQTKKRKVRSDKGKKRGPNKRNKTSE
ncbi:hypothetical protein EDD85DRAFT_793326 [Armillaria nabsnona]|nr:hypothetical protein EDD85DRAFT_793326 [Armillaria nabsnona]